MSTARRRHPYRLVLQIDRAGVARRLHRRRMGAAVAHAGAQDRCRLRRARADGAGRILPRAFRRPCAAADARLARETRNADGRAQRAIRHRGRIRGSERRHFPVGQAAGRGRHAEALSAGARRRRRHQSRPGMGDRQEPTAKAARGCASPIRRTKRSAPASPRSPKSAAANSACRTASPMWRGA